MEKNELLEDKRLLKEIIRIAKLLVEEYEGKLTSVERALVVIEALDKMNEKYDKLDSLAEQRNKLFPTNRTSDRKVEK